MSMDAGGLAQMTYNNFSSNGSLGAPGSGFASRGKGAHIKRLSVAPPPKINSISENSVDVNPTPRTSRSHLLAGLRTQRTAGNPPASAPYHQQQHRVALDPNNYAGRSNVRFGQDVPQTAMAAAFPGLGQQQFGMPNAQQPYCLPEQVLAPPALNMNDDHYDDLMVTNLYLVHRQQQLQEQLRNVTAAAQQFQGLNLNSASTMSPQMSFYNQQLQNGVQPVLTPVHSQPGLYAVFNPMTGHQSYFVDPSVQQGQLPNSPPALSASSYTSPVSESENTYFQRRDTVSPLAAASKFRSNSPPKNSPSPPNDVTPLPPPSANAFRPGHKKTMSTNLNAISTKLQLSDIKAVGAKAVGVPQTPLTGTFGPGMRAGEHPSRQPRGPPPLEELVACPTAKHEGSKNFATRQRRRALFSLVRAGNERRSGRNGSGDAGTPGSESELNFNTFDAGLDANAAGSLSGHSSMGSLRGAATAAIGSERQNSRAHSRRTTGSSFGSNEDTFGKPAVSREASPPIELRKTPLLALASAAEKRKSTLF